MANNKKPTMMEMKNVVSNVISHMNQLYKYVNSLDITVTEYMKFNGNSDEFAEHCKKLGEKAKEKVDKESK